MQATEGWHARLELGYAPSAGRTVPIHRRHIGPLLVQRPFFPEGAHPQGEVCHSYLLHPPAGLVGGDTLELIVEVSPGAHALITTPGAGKVYRTTGEVHVCQRFSVADDAALEWLPQETILYTGSRTRLETRISLKGTARYLGWEIICLGRPAAGKYFETGRFEQYLNVEHDGLPLLSERLLLEGGATQLAALWGLQGQPVTATLLCTVAGFDALAGEAICDRAGEPHVGIAGVSIIDGLLVARYLGPQVRYAHAWFVRLWEALRPVVFGRAACAPRIWAT